MLELQCTVLELGWSLLELWLAVLELGWSMLEFWCNILRFILNAIFVFKYLIDCFGCSLSGFRCSMNSFRCSMNGFRCSMNGFRCSMYSFRCSMNGFRCSLYSFRCAMNGFRYSVGSFGCSMHRFRRDVHRFWRNWIGVFGLHCRCQLNWSWYHFCDNNIGRTYRPRCCGSQPFLSSGYWQIIGRSAHSIRFASPTNPARAFGGVQQFWYQAIFVVVVLKASGWCWTQAFDLAWHYEPGIATPSEGQGIAEERTIYPATVNVRMGLSQCFFVIYCVTDGTTSLISFFLQFFVFLPTAVFCYRATIFKARVMVS